MPPTLRPAVAADQPMIEALVRAARINRLGVRWPNFVVAERDGRLVGIGQLRPHTAGAQELASLAVVPELQGQGIGGLLIRRLQSAARPPVYLLCLAQLAPYYERFGFRRVTGRGLPRSLWWEYQAGRAMMRLSALRHPPHLPVAVMRWDGAPQ